jgi:hypothetical protein
MAATIDKLLITNDAALRANYAAAYAQVASVFQRLIARDKLNGLNTRLINIDDAKDMGSVQKFGARDLRKPMISLQTAISRPVTNLLYFTADRGISK